MHDDDSDNDGNVDHNNDNIVYCTRRWCMLFCSRYCWFLFFLYNTRWDFLKSVSIVATNRAVIIIPNSWSEIIENKSLEFFVFVMVTFMMLAAVVMTVVLVIHAFKRINLCCICYDTYAYLCSHSACCVAYVTLYVTRNHFLRCAVLFITEHV